MQSYLKTSKKDVTRAEKSSDYSSYSSQLQLDINKARAVGNAAEANRLQEEALDKDAFEKLLQAKNYRDEQEAAYNKEEKKLEEEYKKAVKDLERTISGGVDDEGKVVEGYNEQIKNLEKQLKGYDNLDNIKPGGGPGGPGGK